MVARALSIVILLRNQRSACCVTDKQNRSRGEERERATAEAAAWFAAIDAGTADETAFRAWLVADAGHAIAYGRVSATWQAVGGEAPALPARRFSRRALLRTAAVAVPVALIGPGLLVQRAYAWDGATTAVGESRKVTLPDGSVAMLNTDTALAWRFSRNERALRLDRGEVAIDLKPGVVATLADHRRTVRIEQGRINARLHDDALELLLMRGHAELTDRDAPAPANAAPGAVAIEPYQRLSFDAGHPQVRTVSRAQLQAAMAWQSGEILFADTRLADAVAEFNRYLPRKIVVRDAALGDTRIGGRFTSSDPETFLRAVALSLGARARLQQGEYILSR